MNYSNIKFIQDTSTAEMLWIEAHPTSNANAIFHQITVDSAASLSLSVCHQFFPDGC